MHTRHRRLAAKVAQKYLSKTLRDQMQVNLSSARVQLDTLEEMVDRGVRLIEASTHRDHIYREAGDMITRVQSSITDIRSNVAEVSYVVNHMAASSSAQDIQPAARKTLDRLMESKITDPATLQGLPTYVQDVPPAIDKTRADEESIYDVERADDFAKRSPSRRDVVDYSAFSTYLTKPDVKQDDVP